MKKLTLAVYDSVVREMIEQGILPHLPSNEIVTHDGMPHSWQDSQLLVVVVTGIRARADMQTIVNAIMRKQPCGIIALSPSASKWEELRGQHAHATFRCFVAAGVETAYARKKIPGIDILSDIGDLVIPGKQIAQYLWKVVERSANLGPIPKPYASCG